MCSPISAAFSAEPCLAPYGCFGGIHKSDRKNPLNFIAFVAVSLIGTIGLSLLVILPLGIPGRRRTLAALERAEAGTATESDLHLLVDGIHHPVFFMLHGKTARIDAQCVRLFDELGLPPEDLNWGQPVPAGLMKDSFR